MPPNRWTEWVRKWAKDHDTTYGCALSQPECRDEYRGKYGNRKNLTQKKEREMMGAEDKDAPVSDKQQKRKEKLKESKERFGMASEDIISHLNEQIEKAKQMKNKAGSEIKKKALITELKRKQEEKRRLLELSRMMGEDYSVLKPKSAKKKKPLLIIESDSEEEEVKAPPKKSRGRPRKYATKEEAYKAKIAQNRGYKQASAQRVKELMEKMKENK